MSEAAEGLLESAALRAHQSYHTGELVREQTSSGSLHAVHAVIGERWTTFQILVKSSHVLATAHSCIHFFASSPSPAVLPSSSPPQRVFTIPFPCQWLQTSSREPGCRHMSRTDRSSPSRATSVPPPRHQHKTHSSFRRFLRTTYISKFGGISR